MQVEAVAGNAELKKVVVVLNVGLQEVTAAEKVLLEYIMMCGVAPV